MIHDILKTKDNTLKAIFILDRAKTLFHTCGSRFFGDATKESDFDFFTEYSPELYKGLKSMGFRDREEEDEKKIKNNPDFQYIYYRDVNTQKILEMGDVQCMLVISTKARLMAQQTIVDENIQRVKSSTKFWDDLYEKIRNEDKEIDILLKERVT